MYVQRARSGSFSCPSSNSRVHFLSFSQSVALPRQVHPLRSLPLSSLPSIPCFPCCWLCISCYPIDPPVSLQRLHDCAEINNVKKKRAEKNTLRLVVTLQFSELTDCGLPYEGQDRGNLKNSWSCIGIVSVREPLAYCHGRCSEQPYWGRTGGIGAVQERPPR